MSCVVDWEFSGRHQSGEFLTSKEIEALVALNEQDLEDAHWEGGDEYLTSFCTESYGAVERIRKTLDDFAGRFPDVRLFVTYRYETAVCPDGFITEGGKVREITGNVVYTYDDTLEEVV